LTRVARPAFDVAARSDYNGIERPSRPEGPYVRIRSIVTLSTGAALGAGATYLLDPDHGPERRRDARRHALRGARSGVSQAVLETKRRVEGLALATVKGFEQGRTSSRAARARTGLRVVEGEGRLAG
jgi:hypothetical protein